jgi:hypothetical protein
MPLRRQIVERERRERVCQDAFIVQGDRNRAAAR